MTTWAITATIVCVLLFVDAARRNIEVMRTKQDIDVLRVAVFNHLHHGGDPDEEKIRAAIGLDPRE